MAVGKNYGVRNAGYYALGALQIVCLHLTCISVCPTRVRQLNGSRQELRRAERGILRSEGAENREVLCILGDRSHSIHYAFRMWTRIQGQVWCKFAIVKWLILLEIDLRGGGSGEKEVLCVLGDWSHTLHYAIRMWTRVQGQVWCELGKLIFSLGIDVLGGRRGYASNSQSTEVNFWSVLTSLESPLSLILKYTQVQKKVFVFQIQFSIFVF